MLGRFCQHYFQSPRPNSSSVLSQAELQSTLDERADFNQFSGTADQILRFDPHDYVPSHYSLVRVAHAALMSAVFLVIFPLGGMIPRLSSRRATTSDEAYRKLMWLHATLQMIGFWIVIAGAGMGIWMGKEIDQVSPFYITFHLVIAQTHLLETQVLMFLTSVADKLPPYNWHDNPCRRLLPASDRNHQPPLLPHQSARHIRSPYSHMEWPRSTRRWRGTRRVGPSIRCKFRERCC